MNTRDALVLYNSFVGQVLAFFSARLEQHPEQTLSVQVVLDVIKQGTLQWPRDRLKVCTPHLTFVIILIMLIEVY